jgi:hypothetical protein
MSAVVRWESAAPLLAARKGKLPHDPAGSYVISVSGLTMLSDIVETLGAAGLDSMKKTTFIQRNGKAPVAPSTIMTSFDESDTLLFYFPSDADPISAEDKQVVFQAKSKAFGVKAKFVPRDMVYRDKLAL